MLKSTFIDDIFYHQNARNQCIHLYYQINRWMLQISYHHITTFHILFWEYIILTRFVFVLCHDNMSNAPITVFWVKIRLHLIWQANYSPSSKSNWTLLMLKKGVLPSKWRRAISRNNVKRIYILPFTYYFILQTQCLPDIFMDLESSSRLHEYNYTWMVYLQFYTNQNRPIFFIHVVH